MIESPLIQELEANAERRGQQRFVIQNLEIHFGAVPEELAAEIRLVTDPEKLSDLHRFAFHCPDLETFRARLRS